MVKSILYRCKNSDCGYTTTRKLTVCPMCKQFDTFEEVVEDNTVSLKNSFATTKNKIAKRLVDVEIKENNRVITGIKEFDRVMGGGLIMDSLSIISGPPGNGKTTLLIEVCNALAKKDFNVLYASGEESEVQLKGTSLRILGQEINPNFYIIGTNSMDDVINEVKNKDIDFFVIDSIHRFRLNDFSSHSLGSPIQIRECYNALKSICKDNSEKKRACIMIGQVTKDDELRGARDLEHDVDVTLELSTETESSELRFLRATKNRFGGPETGIFKMEERGMKSLDNPSEYFVTHKDSDDNVCGVAMSVIMDGTRPIVIEVESLASPSMGAYPDRIATCIKKDLLNILLSILGQRAFISEVDTNNIIINTTTGIQLKERCTDLAIIMSVYSSLKKIPLPYDTVFLAEVGLTGELKNIPSVERRIREIERMGYKHVIVAKNETLDTSKFKNLHIHKCKNISYAIEETNKLQMDTLGKGEVNIKF